jgi:hypothetical protein
MREIVRAFDPLSQIRRSIWLYHASPRMMSPVEVIRSDWGYIVYALVKDTGSGAL